MVGKQNIADKMTFAYQQIVADEDIGRRLMKLNQMDQKISHLCELRKNEFGTMIAGLGISMMTGIVAMHFTPLASGPALIEGGATFAGVIAGWFGGGFVFGDTAIGNKIEDKRNAYLTAKYMRNISPHLSDLKKISALIAKEKSAILDSDLILDLRFSKNLSQIAAAHPEVLQAFNTACEKQAAHEATPLCLSQKRGLSL